MGERYKLRQEQSKPILNELKEYLAGIESKLLPESFMGRAIRYTLTQWDSLYRYVEIPEAEIDINSAERQIAIGRKNSPICWKCGEGS